MPTNLTTTKIKDTYTQLLHVDGGPAAAEKTVYSAAGVATSLKVGVGSASVDNIRLDGNTISAVDTNGSIVLAPGGTGVVRTDNLAFDGNTISTLNSNGNLVLAPNGSGNVSISNVNITGGSVSGVVFTGSFSGITAITSDSFFTGNTAAGLTLTGNSLLADGTDANIGISITPKGTGVVTTSSVRVNNSIGFASGSGGTVTQLTSRTTGVTLNAPTGQITLVAGSITGLSSQEFTLTNSFIAATDVVLVSFASGLTSAQYDVTVTATANGSCKIAVHNVNNSATPTDTPVINFVVFKGVNS